MSTRERGELFPPLHEAFEGVKLRQPQRIIRLGRVAIAVLGTLPEFALVAAAGEHRPVLLRLMPKDRALLALQIARAQGNDALDLVRLPFLPRAAVKPNLE